MNLKYHITGMTCESCEAKVRDALLRLPDVISAEVSRERSEAVVSMQSNLPLDELQRALGSKYHISPASPVSTTSQPLTWFRTYKPVLLIFAYITGASFLAQSQAPFDAMLWMRHFMAGFFLTFSFFKLLDLNAFADSYAMYDVVAQRFRVWGYIYAFVELSLGIAYLVNFSPALVNVTTLVVMSVSIAGVLRSVLNNRSIRCACLGTVFNLPMSKVTIIEDALMIAMSAFMLIAY